MCIRGRLCGQVFPITPGKTVTLGRSQENMIAYPEGSKGISRKHCVFFLDKNGVFLVKDQRSTYGTYVGGIRIEPEKWSQVRPGQTVRIGDEEYKLI